MICFHHNDLDGKCSAAIWRKHRRENGLGDEYDIYWEIDYGQEFPLQTIHPDEEIVILDFAIDDLEVWEQLRKITKNITWIDHHVSSISKYSNLNYHIDGVRSIDNSACMLTWRSLFPEKPVPTIVHLIDDYDLWKFEYGLNTKYLHHGLTIENTNPKSTNWEHWLLEGTSTIDLNPRLDRIIENGVTIQKHLEQKYAEQVHDIGFSAELNGYNCYCCNSFRTGSDLFDSVDKSNYQMFINFYAHEKGWTVSLYSETIDVSQIAAMYGGGGHKGAAGFNCRQLFFKDQKIEVVL